MSYEDLSNFIFAAEHNPSLRKELRTCQSNEMLIDLASKYGYSIRLDDFSKEPIAIRAQEWFQKSKIKPIKTHFK